MTSSLLLRFKGPLQAWGVDARYTSRTTHHMPTKSAVVGLLGAADGRRRSDPIEDLAGLEFGVRVENPGVLTRDFQTAIDWRKGPPGKVTQRYYLADAHFLAALSGGMELLQHLEDVLCAPGFPLYMGRRSCPAGPDLVVGVVPGDVETVLRAQPWDATRAHRRTRPRQVTLPIYRDARPGDDVEERLRDLPRSFAPEHRDYSWRDVHAAEPVQVDNPEGRADEDGFWEAVIRA